ncbi:hypothetical protein E2C01_032562 [Portunus trituberculatus]|uniref:Uncharacterized protein n=1 Tax=Portunus trituberculatus TaxID=210409 RepID=A0A5B7F1R1_PORTR|nr:hypothetical protein [Portunus trituberculatus]
MLLQELHMFESPAVSCKPTGFWIHQRISWTKRSPLTPIPFPALSSKPYHASQQAFGYTSTSNG